MAVSKNRIKWLKSLHIKKYRQKYNNFIVEGDKMVREVLDQNPAAMLELYALEPWLSTNLPKGKVPADRIFDVSLTELGQMSGQNTPNQALALLDCDALPNVIPDKNGLVLYLDQIQDPGNMGAILRIADWFGLPGVIAGPGSADRFNAKVIQSTMGAFLRVPVEETDLGAFLSGRSDYKILAADAKGVNAFTYPFPEKAVLIIGNEGNGISPGLFSLTDEVVSIPKGAEGGAESLNAAVAAGIICAAFQQYTYQKK